MSASGPPGNPLLEALPPATDYLTYLTVIEYNLTPEALPTLHHVLQDPKLTTNIGWDLVHLLLPLLPASQECLQDIAKLGNPREVILKVTECLRLIDFAGLASGVEDETFTATKTAPIAPSHHHEHDHEHGHEHGITQAVELLPTPLPVDQFISLLSMLSILHGRIKTQHPSRFLSTSLQAVLHAFSNATSHREELISAIVRFLKDVGGTKRPPLPSRKSSSTLLLSTTKAQAPDPESEANAVQPSLDEASMQKRLIHSFLTFVVAEYMLSLDSAQDAPGLAWATRLQEKLHPERVIPGRASCTKQYETDPALHARLSAVGELLAMSHDLGISTDELLEAANAVEDMPAKLDHDESDPPKSAADIPLSKLGSLLLFTASTIGRSLYTKEIAGPVKDSLDIFPSHQHLLAEFVNSPRDGASMIGSEPEALLDALLALALQAIETDTVGQPESSEQFNSYLQVVSLIASNCPSPSLRYMAYYITTTILRSNPSDLERLAFIRDTLEHCPFDNLKVAAVSWIKGETIEASSTSPLSRPPSSSGNAAGSDSESIFATPVAIENLSPFLYPDLSQELNGLSLNDTYELIDQNSQFYLASLNFYYLLISAEPLRQALSIARSYASVKARFIEPLGRVMQQLHQGSQLDGELGKRWAEDGTTDVEIAKLKLMDATLEKIDSAAANMEIA